jgi:hypothetical protein
MADFTVQSYKSRVEVQRLGNPVVTYLNRLIELASVPQAQGIVLRANLSFSTRWDTWSGTPAVGFFNDSDPSAPVLSGWLPAAEYGLWYDLVRSEKPILVQYTISLINGAKYVNQIGIGTSTEPLGEGPADFS